MYYLSDFSTANFSRRKGDKDKKKRQSKLGKLFNGELNPATGKHNVTLREPVIKHTIGGAVLGAGILTGLSVGGLAQSMQEAKNKGVEIPASEKSRYLKYVAKTVAPRAILGSAAIGAGLGVATYISRKREVNRYNKGKHTVNKYEIWTPQPPR